MENQVDLKRLLQLINDQKNLDTNLNLDEGCTIFAQDQAPLIKVINYFLNYLSVLTDKTMEISLDLLGSSILMSMMAFTNKQDLPALSPNLKAALEVYHASYEVKHEPGQYIQIKITFSK
ncbi:MAG: hypothetical protein H6627_06905 [Calditrichae bacterium]|nr:hypothetical protein [Calditrichota bacterium]MCB9058277.1 hypothetical protein [Calditrichia bacterium]